MSGERNRHLPAGESLLAGGAAVRLLKQLLAQRWKLAAVLVSVLFSSAFTLAAPLVIGQAINLVYEGLTGGRGFDAAAMGTLVLILLSLYLISAAFSFLQQFIMAGVAQTLALSLREKVSDKLARLPLSYYDRHKKGDILSRATNDLDKVADTLEDGLMQFFSAAVSIIGAFALMLAISPLLTLIALATMLVSMSAAALIARRTQRCYADNQQALGEMNGAIEEAFTGNQVIKAFQLEQAVIRNVEFLNQTLYTTGRKAQFITYAVDPAIRLFNQIGYIIIAVQGALLVTQGRVSIGSIQAFFQYVNQASEPLTQIAHIFNSMQGAIAAAERVFTLLDEPDETADLPGSPVLSAPRGDVAFEHVRFGYDAAAIFMHDINFRVKAGDKIAIVGPTGAGKTTLINLLMRFYELRGGRITIDGVDISEMSRSRLRSMLGMVLQDTWLFGGSIEDNIAYGREAATSQDVVRAAQAARADHFIRTLPAGYQTVLDDEAANISQGQKQLLTIARAILADPAILILDEATSNVDTRTELEIQAAMAALMKGRTSFIIAHRLSTIRDADLILVMNNGTIIEQGTHGQLMHRNSFYAQLYNSQFAPPAV
ncbi:MAG: ABC transporter ATP-binding protein [Sporomusaceae bacterium]|nr:ABC transporter ATP-binding protein [Sporomusaceae bacterium]